MNITKYSAEYKKLKEMKALIACVFFLLEIGIEIAVGRYLYGLSALRPFSIAAGCKTFGTDSTCYVKAYVKLVASIS